ncbi:methylated-DNA--[protein]-cysteine S-methyltransferase [Luteipulveratus sp. YIM 133132]|uniref:methylated-DNA--[protein]-cysteine S-methyltransferase n=1 Tax=Luteipulveratus flavus TaxID=3031728 RepID=UPI0023AFE084|nr:methylated-DNA--[protein]-cysteine S-methyltransferase [Luteipulveratus sp. YIM 133132]MDE9364952.1 methylated-DNA--[protein]-cysteine S-methyltransferase [Luteipulveratus sp. YIM 133132]
MSTRHQVMRNTPIGPLTLVLDADRLAAVYMTDHRHAPALTTFGPPVIGDPLGDLVEGQLTEYFAGARSEFDLPLASRGTDFQRRVWNALLDIPYGETTTYGALARCIGSPSSARAVGLANGRNPISVIVPCHRVVGAGGDLTGYGGGLPRKRALLELEGRHLAAAARGSAADLRAAQVS